MERLLHTRRQTSHDRLEELVTRVSADLNPILGDERLCIYVTGSYGRLEALVGDRETASDLDLFFLYDADDPSKRFPQDPWYRLAGRLIELVDDLGFPPFSGDAEYLEVHNVGRMREELGSRTDDSVNAFTARLLLLLESRPVLNAPVYDELIHRVVGFYFEDFEGKEASFRPTFLVNDILRFWRTLTLNYEESRFRNRRAAVQDADVDWRAKSAVKNVKLGFSRLSTCFSMVAALASREPPVSAEDVVELVRLTPSERWERLSDEGIPQLLELYDWFLKYTADKPAFEERMRDEEERRLPREQDKAFGDLVFDIIKRTAHPTALRYLVV